MTAVKWLMDKYITQNGVIAAADYHTAKEMEKHQIIDAIIEANKSNNRNVSLSPTDYYSQVYGDKGEAKE